MKMPWKLAAGVLTLITLAACETDSPQSRLIPQSAYSGTGDVMARCMQYASESYCQREIWGGNDR